MSSPYPVVETVDPSDLVLGEVYYAVQFLDDDLTIPIVEPLVFIGWNRFGDETVKVAYFQNAETHRQGVRFETTTAENPADFLGAEEDGLSYIYDFEGLVQSISATAHRRSQLRLPTRPNPRPGP